MRSTYRIMSALLLLVGLSCPSWSQPPYRMTGEIGDGGVLTLSYENRSPNPQCLMPSDFGEFGKVPRFRIMGSDGKLVKFIGDIPYQVGRNRPVNISVVLPGKIIRNSFRLSKNYALTDGEAYVLYYSMPVTDCAYVLQGGRLLGAAVLFALQGDIDPTSWGQREKALTEFDKGWAKAGIWAELGPIHFVAN